VTANVKRKAKDQGDQTSHGTDMRFKITEEQVVGPY